MSKRAEYDCFLDSLPDSILCHILSLLPTRDAVRTSILSPRWRYFFTSSISKLDFHDIKDGLPDSGVVREQCIESFMKFVDRLLFSPEHQRLEYFRVDDLWVEDDDFSSVYNWLCASLQRGVKEIDVFLCGTDLRMLPTPLFTSPSLVTLKLQIKGGAMELPTNVCLPNLRTLHLRDMEFVDGCSFPSLISGCPVLEDLGLFGCFVSGVYELYIHSLLLKRLVLSYETFANMQYRYELKYEFVIDAPSLVYFKYIGHAARGYTLRNIEALERADITIVHLTDVDRDRSATLFWGICNIKVLHLSIHDHDSYARLVRGPFNSVPTFHNLVELESKLSLVCIVEFLHHIPNLKSLILDLVIVTRVSELLCKEVPSCLLHHVKEITIVSYKGGTNTFEMISYFLNHALVLEKLVMRCIYVSQECRLSIVEKLSILPKISKKCEFEIC